jgi:hypothetical protein
VSFARRPQPAASCSRVTTRDPSTTSERSNRELLDSPEAKRTPSAASSSHTARSFTPTATGCSARCTMQRTRSGTRPAGLAGATQGPGQKLASHLAVPDRDQCLPRRDRLPPQARAVDRLGTATDPDHGPKVRCRSVCGFGRRHPDVHTSHVGSARTPVAPTPRHRPPAPRPRSPRLPEHAHDPLPQEHGVLADDYARRILASTVLRPLPVIAEAGPRDQGARAHASNCPAGTPSTARRRRLSGCAPRARNRPAAAPGSAPHRRPRSPGHWASRPSSRQSALSPRRLCLNRHRPSTGAQGRKQREPWPTRLAQRNESTTVRRACPSLRPPTAAARPLPRAPAPGRAGTAAR